MHLIISNRNIRIILLLIFFRNISVWKFYNFPKRYEHEHRVYCYLINNNKVHHRKEDHAFSFLKKHEK